MSTFRKTALLTLGLVFHAVLTGCGGAGQSDANCSLIDIEQLKSAAIDGLVEAQNELGQRYERGECVSTDFDEAARWYQLAAEQGNLNAQKSTGVYVRRWNGCDAR